MDACSRVSDDRSTAVGSPFHHRQWCSSPSLPRSSFPTYSPDGALDFCTNSTVASPASYVCRTTYPPSATSNVAFNDVGHDKRTSYDDETPLNLTKQKQPPTLAAPSLTGDLWELSAAASTPGAAGIMSTSEAPTCVGRRPPPPAHCNSGQRSVLDSRISADALLGLGRLDDRQIGGAAAAGGGDCRWSRSPSFTAAVQPPLPSPFAPPLRIDASGSSCHPSGVMATGDTLTYTSSSGLKFSNLEKKVDDTLLPL